MNNVLHFESYSSYSDPGVVIVDTAHTGVNAHAHDFFELVYIQSGFCLHESGKVSTLLVEGDLFLMPPGIQHKYLGTGRISLFNCLFIKNAYSAFEKELNSLNALKCLFSKDQAQPLTKLHLDLDEQKRFTRLFKQMAKDIEEKEAGWQMRVKCQLACVLIDLARAFDRHVSAPYEKSPYPNYVASALRLITQRFSDPDISVQSIAKETGVTPDYLSRQFRVLTGVGVQEYLRRYRFAKATELLLNGMSVSDVSRGVGFASLCHFSREFKKELGVTPSAYARENS